MSLFIVLAVLLIPVVAALFGTNIIWKLLTIGFAVGAFVAFGMIGLRIAALLWVLALIFAGMALSGRKNSAFDPIDDRQLRRNIEPPRSEPRF